MIFSIFTEHTTTTRTPRKHSSLQKEALSTPAAASLPPAPGSEYSFRVSTSHVLYRPFVYKNVFVVYLKLKFNRTFCFSFYLPGEL